MFWGKCFHLFLLCVSAELGVVQVVDGKSERSEVSWSFCVVIDIVNQYVNVYDCNVKWIYTK